MQAYEIDELVECSQDELHFILTHFKANNPFTGLTTLRLEAKQFTILDRVVNKQFIIDRIEQRQIGTSTILVAHALWLALFHPDQRIVFMNPRHHQAGNIRQMVQDGVRSLPEFLKPKVLTDHKESIEFENGSWIHFTNADPNRLRGFCTTLLIADTFEYFKESYQQELRRHAERFNMETADLLKV